MRKSILLAAALLFGTAGFAQWQPVGDKIKTPWADQVDPQNPLPEYPRPLMERDRWQNLNGLWDYAIVPVGAQPEKYDGKILVPFAVESSLSGVQKRLGGENELWYSREFAVPAKWAGERVLLHFGAVDWKTDVWVNDVLVGRHTGGYTPFTFDITAALNKKGTNTLKVKVWDPTDVGYQPRGKQVNNPSGIWYTPVSGIWQTVWLEPVPVKYIAGIRTTPDIDRKTLRVEVDAAAAQVSDMVEVTVLDGGKEIARAKAVNGVPVEVAMPADMKLWSPDSPFLYDLKVALVSDGKEVDRVDSYTAMRKYSTARDADGIMRLQLNNKDIFHFGPLDQGWWPDGLYTAPTDEALLYDIRFTKQLGFNMIRKHIKVEPERWYWHCDREGILVWQDMPSGDMSTGKWEPHRYGAGTDAARSEESFANYYKEWGEIMDFCGRHPSVVVWVPYNEAWGQYRAEEVADWTKRRDPSRLVNPASGGNYRDCGDMLDLHNYPEPKMYLYDAKRVNVLGEYGGIGLPVEGHLWSADKNWGYIEFKTREDVTDRYVTYAEKLMELVERGFSAAVYTQTTDVEGEVNGLVTYDREVVKVDVDRLHEVNRRLVRSLDL